MSLQRKVALLLRDESGAVVLPFDAGNVTVTSLGVIHSGEAFHSASAIYPVGFSSESLRNSYKHPSSKVRYTYSIECSPDGTGSFFCSCVLCRS